MRRKASCLGAVAALAAIFGKPLAAQAQPLIKYDTTGSRAGIDGAHNQSNSSTTAGSLYGGYTGSYGSAYASVSYGGVTVTGDASAQTFNGGSGGWYTASGTWNDIVTINATNPALQGTTGTVTIPYNFSGTFTYQNSNNLAAFSGWTASGTTNTYVFETPPPSPTPIQSWTETFNITFGQAFAVNGHIDAKLIFNTSAGYVPTPNGQFDMSLRQGQISVSAGGSAVDFTSSSATGSAAGRSYTAGQSFAGFSLTNTSSFGSGTTVSLLGGTAGAATTVDASFVAAANGARIASDVVDLSGTGSNKTVIQMSYDPAKVSQLGLDLSSLFISAVGTDGRPITDSQGNPVNTITLNSDAGAGAHLILGAFDLATDNNLSWYGLDTTNHVVWAVIDHNSLYAVSGLTPTPEPTGVLLLAATVGVSGHVVRRRRRAAVIVA